jgi:hypothetical protein
MLQTTEGVFADRISGLDDTWIELFAASASVIAWAAIICSGPEIITRKRFRL